MTVTFNAQTLFTPECQQVWHAIAKQINKSPDLINFGYRTVQAILQHDQTLNLTPERIKEAIIFYASTKTETTFARGYHGNKWLGAQVEHLKSSAPLNPRTYLN